MRKLKSDTNIVISEKDLAKRLYVCFEPVIKQSTFKGLDIDELRMHLGCLFLNITPEEFERLN